MSFETATPRIASYVIVTEKGKIAFVLRENTSWMDGHYGLPSGKVERGESYSQAAVREAKEEIGIEIDPAELIFVHVMHRMEGDEWVDMFFEAKRYKGIPYNAETNLHSELAWLDPSILPENTIPSVKSAFQHIQAGKTYSEYGFGTTDQN